MPFSADAVANRFIDIATSEHKGLTPMKVQKLVYFANGWCLALTSEPLIKEPIQAWRFGPVVQSLYREFKEFGNQNVSRKAMDLRFSPGNGVEEYYPSLEEEGDADEVEFAKALIDKIWRVYGKYTAIQLSNLSHEEGSPWSLVLKKYNGEIPRGLHIPNQLMQDYFLRVMANQGKHLSVAVG